MVAQYKGVAEAGTLLTFAYRAADGYRRAAYYVDRILKGVKPGDLPIEQPTTFELVINLKTAQTFRIRIPSPVLLRADHVVSDSMDPFGADGSNPNFGLPMAGQWCQASVDRRQ